MPLQETERYFHAAEAPEIVPTVFAANGLGSAGHRDAGGNRGIVVVRVPFGQIHAVAPRTFGEKDLPNAPNAGPEPMITGLTTERGDPQQIKSFAGKRARPGGSHGFGSTAGTRDQHVTYALSY